MKTALVTGAARGIGLATTKQFLAQDWRVIMVDRDADALEEAATPLENTLSIVADVSIPDEVETLAAAHGGRPQRQGHGAARDAFEDAGDDVILAAGQMCTL